MPEELRLSPSAHGGGTPDAGLPGRVALTSAGRGVLATSACLVGGGWGLGYREPVTLGLVGVFAVVGAVLWTLVEPGVTASRRLSPPRTTRGEHATALVSLRVPGTRRRRNLRLADSCGDREIDVALPVLMPRQSQLVRYLVPTPRRGRVPVGPLRVVVADPFGLCRRDHRFGGVEALLVQPRTVPLGVPASGRDPHLDGTTPNAVDSAPSAFHALRPYVPGDDQRMVHWKSTARTGTLIVRQMADVSRPHTTVVLDTDPDHYPDHHPGHDPGGEAGMSDDPGGALFELAVDVCASVACGATALNFPVRLIAGATQLPVGTDGDTGAVLDGLAMVRPGTAGTLQAAVGLLGRSRTGGSLVVVTGPATDAGALRRVGSVRHLFSQVLVVRAGVASQVRADHAAPPGGGVRVVEVADLADLPAAWRRGFTG